MENITQEEKDFLVESNAIEQIYDLKLPLLYAERAWDYMKKQDKMTIPVLLTTHRILMEPYTHIEEKDKGNFRTCDVFIGGQRKRFIAYALFQEQLIELFKRMNDPDAAGDRRKDIWARAVHVEFEDIHPFIDGNGRVGRMLYNWHLLKMGLPIHIIHRGDEQMEYYTWFRKAF